MADTEATATSAEATATAGTNPTPESTNQEPDIKNQLAEYEQKIKEFQSKFEQTEKEKNEAVAKTLRLEAQYRGLQSSTTQKLQEAAELARQLEVERKTREELLEMREYLTALVDHVLDDQQRKEIEFRQRENRIKLAEQAQREAGLRNQQQEIQSQTQQVQYQDVTELRRQFLNSYYPGMNIDPNDQNLDWGDGASNQSEQFQRLHNSVVKIQNQRAQQSSQDVIEQLRKQAEESAAAAEQARKDAEAQIEAAKAAAKEEARKEAEKRLRSMGADIGTTPPSESQRRTRARLEEELDESLLLQGEPGSLKRKQGEQEYARRLDALKRQLTGQ